MSRVVPMGGPGAPRTSPPGRRERAARKRPAEKVGIAGGGIAAVAYAVGVRDPETLVALGVVAAFAPAFVTGVIAHGGVVGLLRSLLYGRKP